jgi:hypothetical protein
MTRDTSIYTCVAVKVTGWKTEESRFLSQQERPDQQWDHSVLYPMGTEFISPGEKRPGYEVG